MSPAPIVNHPLPTSDREVDGVAHVDLTVAEPEVLVRLSRAINGEAAGSFWREQLFRSLRTEGEGRSNQAAARELLTIPEVREALTVTLTPAAAQVLADDLTDAAATEYYGPDDEPRRGPEAAL